MQNKTLVLAALVPLVWACQDSTGPENAGQVTVRFQAVPAVAAAQAAGTFASAASAAPLSIGDAEIDEITLIISELELEGTGGECLEGQDDYCEEVEVGPFLVSLPDDGTGESEVREFIPNGVYSQLEFELENLEADDDDDGSKQEVMASLLAELQTAYDGFPSNASMVVHGTCYDDVTMTTTELTVYFAGEFEVEKDLAPPFEVPGDRSILVYLDPVAWLTVGDQPMDLCAVNGDTVQLEGELDFENGIEVESDD